METENKEAIEQIEQEIVKAKEDPNNFEIEVTDQPQEEDIQPKKSEELKEDEYGQKVEDQFVEVFVEGVSMSGEADIKNDDNRTAENDKEKLEGEKINNSE